MLRQMIVQSDNVLSFESSEDRKPVGDQQNTIKMVCERHKAPAVFFS